VAFRRKTTNASGRCDPFALGIRKTPGFVPEEEKNFSERNDGVFLHHGKHREERSRISPCQWLRPTGGRQIVGQNLLACQGLPDALSVKYPNAGKEWGWQWVFPSKNLGIDPRTLIRRRHHLHENALQKQ